MTNVSVVLNSQNLSTSISNIQSSLTFTQVKLDLESIKCTAFNSLGTPEAEIKVYVSKIGSPCAPVELKSIESGSTWIKLGWSLNSECDEKFQFASSYILDYTNSDGVNMKTEFVLTAEQTNEATHSFILIVLNPNTPYQVIFN